MSFTVADLQLAIDKVAAGDPLTVDEQAGIDAHNAVEQLKTDLGANVSPNRREYVSNKIVLALANGDTPEASDVAELQAAIDALEASPAKDAVLAS